MSETPFSAEDLQSLKRKTFLADCELHSEIASTNDRALELCRCCSDDAPVRTPYLVLAESQTSGRGRGANRWWSKSGALTFSLILCRSQVPLPLEQQSRLSLLCGIAVCETLAGLAAPQSVGRPPLGPQSVGLKWPNDVWLKGRKVCGILIEVAPQPLQQIVIGIGFNANNSFREAPPELRATATSLCDEWGGEVSRAGLLADLLQAVERELEETRQSEDRLAERFGRWCLLTGSHVRMETERGNREGICRGIDGDGKLLLETAAGLERFIAGQAVRFSPEGGLR